MARVTVEDCVERVPNRFELVMLAAQRARNIGAGSPLTLDRDNDKNPVVALREIAGETVGLRELEASLVQSLQKVVEADEPGEEEIDLAALQRELSGELDAAVNALAEGADDVDDDSGDEADDVEAGIGDDDTDSGLPIDPDAGIDHPGRE